MRTIEELYAVVRGLPIVDWHNHLDVRMLAEDRPLGSLCEVWVRADPYKHRAMRICGEPEELITGGSADQAGGSPGHARVQKEDERWAAWMRTLPKLVGNPIFAWAKMELEFLGLDVSKYLRGEGENVQLAHWTPSKLLKAMHVETVCPCVGAGSLPVAGRPFTGATEGTPVAPPENAFFTRNGRDARYPRALPSLRMNADDIVADEQLAAFAVTGCRVVDVSVDDDDDLERHFDSLAKVAGFAAAHGWTMLLHLGALRETSARLRRAAGPAGGYAGMRAPVDPEKVAKFLGRLECLSVPFAGALPRTILLSLNPEAHAQLAVLAGSFNEAGVPGKVQLGPAWWWCDHEEGIRDVLEKNAAYGVLSTFVGMTTDSRSILSFVRHGYFRRVLCRWMAEKIASGAFPEDEAIIRPLLEKVCYWNARKLVDE